MRSRCSQFAHRAARQSLLHGFEQFLQGNGLFQKSQRADFCRLYRSVDGGVATHHDHWHGQKTGGGPLLEQSDAMGIGHPDIEQHQVRPVARARRSCLLGVLRQLDVVAFVVEDFHEEIADAELIVDHQYVCHVYASFLEFVSAPEGQTRAALWTGNDSDTWAPCTTPSNRSEEQTSEL